ncbi:MAG TPA: peroxiredoxin [Crenotrichaceae bacterium]|nr:peroxiredoxin [Crenotrichaceae bacterium]
MTAITVGNTVADFEADSTDDQRFRLSDYKGSYLVLYFYPRDNTPGCTKEGQDFAQHFSEFEKLNTGIFGISRDTLAAHQKFREKYNFPFHLIADPDETICTSFDVIKMKNMYGKQVRGIERSTFLLDPDSVLIHEWRKVKVKDHVEQVLEVIRQHSV